MIEEEQKYEVDDAYVLPDLAGTAPAGADPELPPVTLVARYLDTVDLRLARPVPRCVTAGATSFLDGETPDRHAGRAARDLPPRAEEAAAAGAGRVGHRAAPGAPLAPVTVVRTVRHAYEVCDRAGEVLAEVVDDRVTVLDEAGVPTDTFRELEVELKAGDRELLDRVGTVLRDAGARDGSFTPSTYGRWARRRRPIRTWSHRPG
ncbi:hypothetical protein NKG94_26035 [Micromonospora sp. M12]